MIYADMKSAPGGAVTIYADMRALAPARDDTPLLLRLRHVAALMLSAVIMMRLPLSCAMLLAGHYGYVAAAVFHDKLP